jgi:DNA repair protein RadC
MLAAIREDLPREKLTSKGAESLGNNELLAVLLETGLKHENVLQLADKILSKFPLQDLGKASVAELMGMKGVGSAKACKISATFELGKRMFISSRQDCKVNRTEDALRIAFHELHDENREKLVVLLLDRRSNFLKKFQTTTGSDNALLIETSSLFREMVRELADAFIILHNHPSGNPLPSDEDLRFTKKLKKCSQALNIILLDHIIVSKDEHFSFREAGLLQ